MKFRKLLYKVGATGSVAGIFIFLIGFPLDTSSKDKPFKAKKNQKITRVIVDPVRQETTRQTVNIIGRFLARQTGPVAARTAGIIEEFRAEVGDRVTKGDVIAVLMKERLVWQHKLQKAEVEHYVAQLQTKKRQIKLFQQELKRLHSLKNSPAFSQARLDDKSQEVAVATSAASEAQARLNMAKANLRLTTISLHDAEIKAPYSGIISQHQSEVGNYVGKGSPVAIMINDKSMEIEADIPSIRILGLKTDMVVNVKLDNNTRFKASIRAIIPAENPRTRTRAVRLTPILNNQNLEAAINQPVTLLIPTGPQKNLITVHKDAVLVKQSKRAVFVAHNNKAQIRFIKLGQANGSRFSVIQGLKPRELVVIRGNERLRPGTPLLYKNENGNASPHKTSKSLQDIGLKK